MDQALARCIEARPYIPPIAAPGGAVRHRSMVWRSRPIGCPHGGNDDSDRLTLHLDLLARGRGYKRFGASLVEV